MSHFLSWLIPQTLETIESSSNKTINLIIRSGKPALFVDNFEQSGPSVEKIWRQGLNRLAVQKCSRILVLGLGAGVVARLLNEKFPSARMTGVEIDSAMISLGKKYFALNQLNNLKIVISDASDFLAGNQYIFDLILVDLYLGGKIPEKFISAGFFKNLARILSPDGTLLLNVLTTKTNNIEPEKLIDKLKKLYKIRDTVKIDYNSIFFLEPLP